MSIFGREHGADGIGVCLVTLTNEFEADRAIAALKSQGICAYKHEDGANQLMGIYMGAGDSHPVSVFVAEEVREQAAELLEEMGFVGELSDSSNIRLITHTAIRMEVCGKVLYLDPYQLKEDPHDADLVLITHEHYDHYSPEDLGKVAEDKTQYVFPESMREKIAEERTDLQGRVHYLRPGQMINWEGIQITGIWAYTIGKDFHPREEGWLGYLIDDQKQKVYVAGDTDATAEAKAVVCDIALIPCGGRYTSDPEQAAELANAIAPDIVIPSHYGSVIGDASCAERFERLVDPQIRVERKMEYLNRLHS